MKRAGIPILVRIVSELSPESFHPSLHFSSSRYRQCDSPKDESTRQD